jgi:hypothetical protein
VLQAAAVLFFLLFTISCSRTGSNSVPNVPNLPNAAGVIPLNNGHHQHSPPTASPSSSPSSSPLPSSSPSHSPSPNPSPSDSATPSPPPNGSASYHGCPLYTANDWFTTNLVAGGSSYVPNTVDPNSSSIINSLVAAYGTVVFSKNIDPPAKAANIDDESSAWFLTSIVQAPTWYGFYNDAQNDDPGPPYHMPVTNGNYWQGGSENCYPNETDCHVVVLDTVKCVDYETWIHDSSTYPRSWNNGTYTTTGGGVINLHAPDNPPQHVQVSAAGLPMMGTADWGEDETTYNQASCRSTNSCVIPHILSFYLPNDSALHGYVDPATADTSGCGGCSSSNSLPYGARLRLKSSYACPVAASYPQANLLCNQAKEYGWILQDTTAVSGWGGVRLGLAADGSDPWNSSDIDQFLSNVRLTDFDVMTLGTVH